MTHQAVLEANISRMEISCIYKSSGDQISFIFLK